MGFVGSLRDSGLPYLCAFWDDCDFVCSVELRRRPSLPLVEVLLSYKESEGNFFPVFVSENIWQNPCIHCS